MSKPQHYSPAIKRHLVTVLYHEAKRQGRPMTVVTNDILEKGLREMNPQSPSAYSGDSMVLHESSPPCPSQ